MKKIYQYLVACCITALAIMPSDAYAAYSLQLANGTRQTLASSTQYYLNGGTSMYPFIVRDSYATSLVVPASGTITAVYGNIFSLVPANARAEPPETPAPCTINIIQNGTTTTQVTNSLVIGNNDGNPFSNTTLNHSVVAGDVLQVELITPEWASAPMYCSFSVSLFIE